MDRVEPFVPCERRSDLLRRRPAAVEHNRLNLGAHVAENCLKVGDRRIDKKNFSGTGHDWLLLASNSVQTETAHRPGR
ncbi:hypothetical protein X760_20745 [Mesorhizobium sp. LSHC422A00]|uniref:hypothetical protein n=1 Tax=unclassified Mesorhizobium TaxID=325217 RepID=UPI0003CF0338|nr:MULTISPECIES: hypothetical protein [unclassified Mesorhizobium]ESX58400.1 hypothetical protein X760_20745 [Mesorhizobium sp. LSHC422A00]ESZ78581.1 hypothetical protein X726_00975 [Mesorhizobium sp. L103C105A0]